MTSLQAAIMRAKCASFPIKVIPVPKPPKYRDYQPTPQSHRPLVTEITIATPKEWAAVKFPPNPILEIQKAVAEHFKFKNGVHDLLAHRRVRKMVRPRQIAIYLCRELTLKSLPEIGRKFAGRDHTTILHSVRKIEELIQTNPAWAAEVEVIRRRIGK